MMDSSQVELPTLGDLELPEDTQLPTEAPEVPEELAEVEAPIEVAPASGEVHADVAEVSGSATQVRRRLAVQSPGFGVFARAAAEAAAAAPVLNDPYQYWVAPESAEEREAKTARERLRKVAILVLSEADAEKGMKLSEFMDSLEQLHPQVANDMKTCSFTSAQDMLKAMKSLARLGEAEGEERLFPLFPLELEASSDGEVKDGRMTMKVDRTGGAALGLSVAPDKEQTALEILDINDGLVKEWCQKRPSRKVFKGDRIVAVNKLCGCSQKLVDLLRQDGPLVLSIMRGPPPRGGRGGGGKGKGRGEVRVPGAAAKSSFRRRSFAHRPLRGYRSRSRSRRSRGRHKEASHKRRTSRRGSRSRDDQKTQAQMFEKISRRAICAVCMKPLGAFGTLDLRKCGHRVHAQCLVGVERDEEGHPMCEACKFIARYNSLKSKKHHPRKEEKTKKKRKRRSSSSRHKKGRRHGRSSSSSRSESSAGWGSSEDSKPPGLLTAIRGTSRFCSACGQHMGWVEKLTPSAMQSAPQPLCGICQAKKEKQENEKANVESEDLMEVDAWGFQMAMDQVKEAACPEDGAAVLEALLKSKPSEEFLKEGSWESTLEELVKAEMKKPEEGARHAALAARLAALWRRARSPAVQGETRPKSPEGTTAESAVAASTGDASEASEIQENVEGPDVCVSEVRGASGPGPTASKGFLGALLQRARQKAKDKISAALPLARPAEAAQEELAAQLPKPSAAPWVGRSCAPGTWNSPPMYPWAPATQPLPY